MVLGEPIEKTVRSGGREGSSRNQGNNVVFNDKTSKRLINQSAGSVDEKCEYGGRVKNLDFIM